MIKKGQEGYIALLSTLVIGAVALSVTVAVLLMGTVSQQAILAEQRSVQARGLANACAEEALQQIHDNTTFTGTNSVTITGESCSYTVASTSSSTRTITTNCTIGSVVRKVQVYVTIASSSISITSWQEVS